MGDMRASVGAFNLVWCVRFHQPLRLLRVAAFEFLNDWAVRPLVAVAALREMLEGKAHLVELARLAPELRQRSCSPPTLRVESGGSNKSRATTAPSAAPKS